MPHHHFSLILGASIINSTEHRIHYRFVNADERNRIKNNDKSIAALEGKNLLLDDSKALEVYSGNTWKLHKGKSDYLSKMMLKEKYAKHLGLRITAQPDNALGKFMKYSAY